MDIQVSNGEGLQRNINVVVPAAEVDARLNLAYEAAAKTAKVDGFREGMAPVSVVKAKIADKVRAQAAQELIQAAIAKAVKDNNLNLAGNPHVHAGDTHEDGPIAVTEGQDFKFHAHAEVYPTIAPKAFEGLKLTRETAEATDEVVDIALARLSQQLKTFKDKDGAAATGDRVTISGQGYKVDGGKEEAFDGGKLEGFPIVIGSGQLIPGFEEGLVDAKKGDQLDVDVTFPADYHAADLAGKPAKFKLTIDKVEEGVEEPLDDAAAKQLGFEGLDKLKEVLKNGAARDLQTASQQRLKRQMLDQLDDANKFDVPGGLIQNEHAALWRAQLQELQMRKLPLEALGKPVEEAIADLQPLAERRVRLGLLMAEIARLNKITVTGADLDKAVQAQVEMSGPQGEQVQRHFMKPENRQQLAGPVLEDKVTQFILDKATIEEKKVDAKDLLDELQ
ncbi:MAG: trigger factor [Pseudomonadaceae bacterium]|nr:trigger factor [Pseudomonadaceae bacterium]